MIRKSFRTNALCMAMCLLFAGGVSSSAQTTEGKDFWVTFLRGDAADNDGREFSLSFSARETCEVLVENTYSGYRKEISVEANSISNLVVFSLSSGRDPFDRSYDNAVCYSFNSEKADTSALHITSTKPISVFATNYKKATFDATNVLPTDALLDEYLVQCYTPSDHDGGDNTTQQGSHFAIVAVEDNTVVTYAPTVETPELKNFKIDLSKWGSDVFETYPEYERFRNYETDGTVFSDTLKKGQVWYVWSGTGTNGDAHNYDLSGTHVKANKKIAVFQGNPHTNLPYYKDYGVSSAIRERDHLFSQAMPTATWGNTFALTATKTRKRDIVRIMAINDGTEVRINGELKHTFDFSQDTKQYWEFEFGEENVTGDKTTRPMPTIVGKSCFVETSCPCAVHSFIVSRRWDGPSDNNGDPAMLWINPIEQQIDQITFTTYNSKNGTSSHFVNIVTTPDNVSHITLDGVAVAESEFEDVAGSNGAYQFAQLSLGSTAESHTLKGADDNGFIAHVYGLTANESYGYNAGGSAKVLEQSITINGEVFTPGSENKLCGEDTIKFVCRPNYDYEKIEWYFGDGTNELNNKDSVPHFYENTGVYEAYVLIYRQSSNVCVGQSAVDSIPITVTIGRYEFSINDISIPCPEDGKEYIGKVFYSNAGKVNLHGDNVTIEFDDAAIAAGFKNDELMITDDYFQITIPETAEPDTYYGIHMVINSDCGGADTTMNFMLNYDKDVITQRYNNVLGLQADYFRDKTLSDIQWYRTSDSTAVAGQVSANLNFRDLPEGEFEDDTYYVCFTINKGTSEEVITCACAKAFIKNDKGHNFGEEDIQTIVAYSVSGDKIFVNADWGGETDIECYAQWITTSGSIYQNLRFDIPDGGCTIPTPTDNGLYLLRVVTDKQTRSFKFSINH